MFGLLDQWGELGGPSKSRIEQPHKQERHHTRTQNLKAMGLWVLLLIRCSTFTFLFDVGHITHSFTQLSPSSVSPSIHHAPPSSGSSYLFVSPLLVSPQTDRDACIVVAAFCANRPAASVVPFVEPGLLYHFVGKWEVYSENFVRNLGGENIWENSFYFLREYILIPFCLLDLQITNSPLFIGSKGEFETHHSRNFYTLQESVLHISRESSTHF